VSANNRTLVLLAVLAFFANLSSRIESGALSPECPVDVVCSHIDHLTTPVPTLPTQAAPRSPEESPAGPVAFGPQYHLGGPRDAGSYDRGPIPGP
jgi:hypothetical protein